MDNLHHWFQPVHECTTRISIPIILERIRPALKQFEDGVGGITSSEGVGEGYFCYVYANLSDIVIKCIDDESKVRHVDVDDIL